MYQRNTRYQLGGILAKTQNLNQVECLYPTTVYRKMQAIKKYHEAVISQVQNVGNSTGK